VARLELARRCRSTVHAGKRRRRSSNMPLVIWLVNAAVWRERAAWRMLACF
jgi:hypothetical protein